MSRDQQPEVIDPKDQRYKDDDYFKQAQQFNTTSSRQSYHYSKNIGCGCGPLGCLSGCMTLILLSALITFLLNFFF
ncbi:hypothetical protein [Staphylococcus caeli]|uniref:Uncharacterized protein n=1 Tax=Staphylococcus caeli TaxID=2201815 RepID=A0A1D4HFN4_9STAP|nr:hypothetical protein [Staphylococcus caeli]SCS31593.1 Uncharacterised protein [Staphylococcus caeli]SCS35944.1 Uncharacterised protein [Staphylococcus caeli]